MLHVMRLVSIDVFKQPHNYVNCRNLPTLWACATLCSINYDWGLFTDVHPHKSECIYYNYSLFRHQDCIAINSHPFRVDLRNHVCIRWGAGTPVEGEILGLSDPLRRFESLLWCTQQKLNWSRCRCGWLEWAHGTTYWMGVDVPHGKRQHWRIVRLSEKHWESLLRCTQQNV